ncbi:unnamed protein product [Penicillium olsonii]|uniref:Uncharacterized protein n=1 Tax=Penicillium olsonii TaxID=99116 RepID=A0A9W4HDW5_PENOL|nr:unnamed protein product [Penicillium olsonii]CAG8081521.1 unnamed protein product [Penicillium olsonii]
MLAIFEFNVLHVVHHLIRAYSRLGLCLFALVRSVFTTCISSVSMSDDEEYYEYEEDFMYEDLVPDMVDDLAASSYYEAALYEDPGIDVEDYFSDWDYYSDDHYDDDPTAERSAERKKRTDLAATAKRRTKGPSRKTTTIPTKSPLCPDPATFQGVLWKTSALDRDQDVAILYEPDSGEKVALLANWREVFKSAQPALDKSKLKRRPVENRLDEEADNEMSEDESGDRGSDDEDLDEPDTSDEVSDGESLPSAVDTGDASNTTPDPEPDARVPKLASPPKVVIPLISMDNDTPSTPSAPTKGAKRGRKRKAVPQDDSIEESEPRSKRIESRKGGGERTDSPAPVRRSARQKK